MSSWNIFLENLKKLTAVFTDIWQHGIGNIPLGNVAVAALILLFFLTFRQLFTNLILKRIRRWTKKSKNNLDNLLIQAFENPVRFVPVLLGVFFALQALGLKPPFDHIGDNIVRSLMIFVIFWGFHNAVQPFSFLLRKLEKVFNEELVEWLVKTIKVGFIFIGSASILESWGIKVGPLLAGLGLFGIAVALGAQDLFKNLIAGILILAEKRFQKGDFIKVEGIVEGIVESIGFRSTLVRRFDKAPVHVPNTKLSDSVMINFSRRTHRRILWNIGLEYRTTTKQLRQIKQNIKTYITNNPRFANSSQAGTAVYISDFKDSSIDIFLSCFTISTDWGDWLAAKEDLACAIKDIVEEADAGFAFPSHSLYIEKTPDNVPESFVPPKAKKNPSSPPRTKSSNASPVDSDDTKGSE